MLEGLLCGLGGAFMAVVLLVLGKEIVLPAIIPTDYTSPDVRAWSFSLIALTLILIGLGVGAIGSGLTLRRFLKV
jgi:cell division protein FtsX